MKENVLYEEENVLYEDGYCFIKYAPEKHSCFYADEMMSFIPMSYSVGKYIASRMESNMRFAYRCVDYLERRI